MSCVGPTVVLVHPHKEYISERKTLEQGNCLSGVRRCASKDFLTVRGVAQNLRGMPVKMFSSYSDSSSKGSFGHSTIVIAL